MVAGGTVAAGKVMQYSLRAAEDGVYPVLRRGSEMAVDWVELKKGDIWKFGTTINEATRYPKSWLDNMGLRMQEEGRYITDKAAREAQKTRNFLYEQITGSKPPGNKIGN